jgi:hypothetical protein
MFFVIRFRRDARNGDDHGYQEAFPAPEAKRLVERFEWHYTPKHGSWLNLAESELGVLTKQCLGSPYSRQTNPHRRNRRMAARPKHKPYQSRLAIHDQKCSHQAQASIPVNLNESAD